MPRTTASPQTKRDEIVGIASRLFYLQGFGATGIKQIIDEAGVAKGTFYTHFKSKEELGVEWLSTRHLQWNTWLSDALQAVTSESDKILAAFTYLESWMKDSCYRGCAFLNTMAETPDASSAMRQEVIHHKGQLHDLFQSLAADHFQALSPNGQTIDKQEIKQLGSTIYLLFEGALVEAQNFQDPWPITVAQQQVQTLLRSQKIN